jgi:hypothetical protein
MSFPLNHDGTFGVRGRNGPVPECGFHVVLSIKFDGYFLRLGESILLYPFML